jgi:hypothetical protein
LLQANRLAEDAIGRSRFRWGAPLAAPVAPSIHEGRVVMGLRRLGEQLLTLLRRVIPLDGAWLALADPLHPRYTTLAGTLAAVRAQRTGLFVPWWSS